MISAGRFDCKVYFQKDNVGNRLRAYANCVPRLSHPIDLRQYNECGQAQGDGGRSYEVFDTLAHLLLPGTVLFKVSDQLASRQKLLDRHGPDQMGRVNAKSSLLE